LKKAPELFIGTAGWSIPAPQAERCAAAGSHLARYARCLPAVEINTSFYRSHRPATYERWAGSVPADFKFSLKLPKAITHEHRLVGCRELVDAFLAEAGALGDKLGPILVQLPPSLEFNRRTAGLFFKLLRQRVPGPISCEARHPSWFEAAADSRLAEFQVARVAADPAIAPAAATPGGWLGWAYYRLHGSPRMYYSAYTGEYLEQLASRLRRHTAEGAGAWCIFDNTTLGAALGNALDLAASFTSARPGS